MKQKQMFYIICTIKKEKNNKYKQQIFIINVYAEMKTRIFFSYIFGSSSINRET